MILQRLWLAVVLATIAFITIALTGGCISVETSSGGFEEQKSQSEETAARYRREWAGRIQGATSNEIAMLLTDHVDNVNSQYVDFADRIASRWDDGNKGRGQAIPASEMREFIDGWTAAQQPILTAYDDMTEYALREIKERGDLSPSLVQQLDTVVEEYYSLYNVVLLPNETLADYRYSVEQQHLKLRDLVESVESELQP